MKDKIKLNKRLIELMEVLTIRFPDLHMGVDFGEIHMISFITGEKETFRVEYVFIEYQTDQEIIELAEEMYLYKKEIENE